jgi:hypothetical protein
MNEKMLELVRRRSELLESIAVQREQLAEIGTRLQTPLALADLGLAALRFFRSRHFLVALAVAIVTHRRGVFGIVKGVWRLWKGYRQLSNSLPSQG